MNIFHKITLQSLKKNRVRTLLTIIGVILSATMICAVTTFVVTLRTYLLADAIYDNGEYYGEAAGITAEKIEQLEADSRLSHLAVSGDFDYAKLEKSQNSEKPYLFLYGVNTTYTEIMPIHLIDGRLPETTGEILIPGHLEPDSGVSYAIGDRLTLEIGDRVQNGQLLTQDTAFLSGAEGEGEETFVPRETREYEVVGFYKRPDFENYDAPGYTVLTIMNAPFNSGFGYQIHFKTHDPVDVYAFMAEHELGERINRNVLLYTGVSQYDSFYVMLYGFAGILIAIIMFGSVSLIYNGFAISVNERTKQFGLLVSVGATKKQIRKSVLFEALFVSSIGIPLGIGCGVGTIALVLYYFEKELNSLLEHSGVIMQLQVSWLSVLTACIIALVTVLLSAWIPSKRATGVNAMEAIRQTKDIRIKGKDVKGGKILYRLFGLEGMLAQKHFKRNRKKYRATIFSLFMSVVLFISTSAFGLYFTRSVEGHFATNGYDLEYDSFATLDSSDIEEDCRAFLNVEGITEAAYTVRSPQSFKVPVSYLTPSYLEYLQQRYEAAADVEREIALHLEVVSGSFCFVQDAAYEKWLREQGLDVSVFMDSQNPVAVAYGQESFWNEEEGKYYNRQVWKAETGQMQFYRRPQKEGDYHEWTYYNEELGEHELQFYLAETNQSVKIPVSQMEQVTLQIGASVTQEEFPFFAEQNHEFFLMYPFCAIPQILGEDYAEQTYLIEYKLLSTDHAASYLDLEEYRQIKGGFAVTDYTAQVEQNRSAVQLVRLFAYSLTLLITFIAVVNVFHTISTNIGLRRREFAMLQSVGLTAKGFRKMMCFECLLYGVKSLLFGLPVSLVMTYLLYLVVNAGYEMPFQLPWSAIAMVICGVFLIVFVTMLYSMRKIQRQNTIDALKNENL